MIYFITQGDDYVKIGYTKNNPGDRLISLQIGNPNLLVLYKVIDGGKAKEEALHTRFNIYHRRGEWYWLSGELKRYINSERAYSVDIDRHIEKYKDVVSILNGNRA